MSAESTQVRPSLPRPSVWLSASATAPCAASGGSIRCVVGATSAQWYSRPNVPRSAEPTAEGSSRISTASTVGASLLVQPSLPRSRRIVRDLRPDGPLVYEKLSDPILVRRTKDGDTRALEALCARHSDRVYRIALHMLRDTDDASDAAQEAL